MTPADAGMMPVDLTNCDREPIHLPGAIQPHGVLFACDAALTVRQVSANVAAFFGVTAESLLGKPLATLFLAAEGERLRQAADAKIVREVNPLALEASNGGAFDAVLHRPPNRPEVLVVELEPRSEATLGFHPRMRASIARLQAATDLASLMTLAAEEVRTLTGFDRTMIYRFDRDWNGEVVAEAKRADLEPFLGHHYPASDIPSQARRLYTINWLRFIGDVSYVPSPLEPAWDPDTQAPLDLSFSVLRSVSPIHIEYLKNMGVTASMSISLLRDGELTGLIACHHYSGPRVVPYTVRETAEYLGQVLSWHSAVLMTALESERTMAARQVEAEIVTRMALASNFVEGLASPDLLRLTESSGAAVVFEGRVLRVGKCPSEDAIRDLVTFLKRQAGDTFATSHLAAVYPLGAAFDDLAAGVLALEIARDLGDFLLWFRPATERIVAWAGNPEKNVTTTNGFARLSPRGSFEVWRETVRGKSLPWEAWQQNSASILRRAILNGVRKRAEELREMNDRLRAADRAKDVFIATVSHELRTPLNAITGWTQMMSTQKLAPERVAHAVGVIDRNARRQAQLVEDLIDISRVSSGKLALEVSPVDLVGVIEQAMESVTLSAEARSIRLRSTLDTRASHVIGDAARLQQVVQNLLNNAIKFTPKGGSVHVVLQRVGSSVEISVTDTGQGIAPEFLPHVFELFRQEDEGISRQKSGLGLGLALVRTLTELHGGEVRVTSAGAGRGSQFTVRLPTSPIHARGEVAENDRSERSDAEPGESDALAGLTVLVVEDEPDARDLLRAVLESNGAKVVDCASAAEALEVLPALHPDVLVSDIGLPEMDGYALMRAIRALSIDRGAGTPAVALTAFTRAQDRTATLRAGFQAHVPKPVDSAELVTVIASLASRFTPTPQAGPEGRSRSSSTGSNGGGERPGGA